MVSQWPRSVGFSSVLGKKTAVSVLSVWFGFLTSTKTGTDVQR